MKIYKTALVCLMTCAVAFFGCSCSLFESSESSKSKMNSIIEKTVTTPSAQDVENNKDYVKLARAKGVNESKITMRHVFRNALVPMIQYIPTSLMYTVCGSIYIESLYSIPGMGGLLVDVISRQDNPMVQAIVMIYSCIGIVGLILGDLLMVLVDPRISLHGKGDAR